MIPKELIEGDAIFVELDRESYNKVLMEVEELMKVSDKVSISEGSYPDISNVKTPIITLHEHKIVVVLNKDKYHGDNFYVAFKTKIL